MNFTYSTIFIPLSYLNITLSTQNIFGESEVFCYSEILPGNYCGVFNILQISLNLQ